jgi:putative ABC transport system permease protein
MAPLLLRWTWRDFRSRWIEILTTSLILALGIGAFAGVGGLREWREASADRSFAALRGHDLRVDLAAGGHVPAGTLRRALRRMPAGAVTAAEERLVVETQIEAAGSAGPVLVPARVVGVPLRPGGQLVDGIAAHGSR